MSYQDDEEIKGGAFGDEEEELDTDAELDDALLDDELIIPDDEEGLEEEFSSDEDTGL